MPRDRASDSKGLKWWSKSVEDLVARVWSVAMTDLPRSNHFAIHFGHYLDGRFPSLFSSVAPFDHYTPAGPTLPHSSSKGSSQAEPLNHRFRLPTIGGTAHPLSQAMFLFFLAVSTHFLLDEEDG